MSLIPIEARISNDTSLGGGLNSTGGPLHLKDNESSDLQNVDFNKFGSIVKRNGYSALNTAALTGSTTSEGLWWYEYNNVGTLTKYAICVNNGNCYNSTESLGGTWTNITAATVTAGNHCDFENFLNRAYITNGTDKPFYWTGTGSTTNLAALQANSFTFDVTGITNAPAVGDVYSHTTLTFTIREANLTSGAGTLVMTGTPTPLASGTLGGLSGTNGDLNITFVSFAANADIEKAKFVKQFNNYLFLADITLTTTRHPSRIYWSRIKDTATWPATNWIEISKDDGQEIQGIKVLQDRLVIYKSRAIYNLFFTGDSDIPFVLPGGGKSNSTVGCVSPWSICEVENGHVFLSTDGIYFYDGNSSYKLSDKITTTLMGYALTNFSKVVATVYKQKNFVYFAFPSGSDNDVIVVWNYFLNAWSIYSGIEASSMCTFYQGTATEIPCFADYSGFIYRMDYGTDDYPLNVQTAVNAYYWTNWRTYDNLISKKGILQVVIYYLLTAGTLTFGYSYDFADSIQYSSNFEMMENPPIWGSVIWGAFTWLGTGGGVMRRDLTGRGRVVRFYIANSTIGETFRIDGIGGFIKQTSVV